MRNTINSVRKRVKVVEINVRIFLISLVNARQPGRANEHAGATNEICVRNVEYIDSRNVMLSS